MIPGAVFPDYELSDHTGKHRKLSELQQQDPMVIVLSRGGYCPKPVVSMKDLCNCIVNSRWAIAG
jgi:peroxiredoxin